MAKLFSFPKFIQEFYKLTHTKRFRVIITSVNLILLYIERVDLALFQIKNYIFKSFSFWARLPSLVLGHVCYIRFFIFNVPEKYQVAYWLSAGKQKKVISLVGSVHIFCFSICLLHHSLQNNLLSCLQC